MDREQLKLAVAEKSKTVARAGLDGLRAGLGAGLRHQRLQDRSA